MNLGSHKVGKVKDTDFGKKNVWTGQEGPKSPESVLKMRFLGFRQKPNRFICTFLL